MDGFLFYSEYLTNMLAESESYLVFFILVGRYSSWVYE